MAEIMDQCRSRRKVLIIVGEGVGFVFTSVLTHGLSSGETDLDDDSLVSIDELYHYTYDHVCEVMPEQRPRFKADVEGNIFLAKNPGPVKPARLPQEVLEAMQSPLPHVRAATVEELKPFLQSYHKEKALAAMLALKRLFR